MSKYSGLFLSFLLIFLCLWVNICRFPQVWEMVNGTDRSSADEQTDANNEDTLETRTPSPFGEEPFYARMTGEDENWPKPVMISANYPVVKKANGEKQGSDDWSNESSAPFRQVSYSANQCSAETNDESLADESSSSEEVSEGEQTEEIEKAETDEIVRVHSTYMAAKFSEESSPLNSESPSYEVR
jgi:type II secretory pathway pseudopilin PulG